jgi:hypothetical protein
MVPPLFPESLIIDFQLNLSITELYFKKTKITSIFLKNFKKNLKGVGEKK